MNAVKATLSTKKVVILRDIKISDTEKAAEEVAPRAGDNQTVFQVMMQRALLCRLVLQVDDKKPTAAQLADIDELFTMGEYNQLLQVVKQMTGGDESGKAPALEVVSFGDK